MFSFIVYGYLLSYSFINYPLCRFISTSTQAIAKKITDGRVVGLPTVHIIDRVVKKITDGRAVGLPTIHVIDRVIALEVGVKATIISKTADITLMAGNIEINVAGVPVAEVAEKLVIDLPVEDNANILDHSKLDRKVIAAAAAAAENSRTT